ncbi:hypothetical protein IC229_09700 [Spirosoma sp. BT702]|uniref:Uncharacterized protein n=1 Tax=Spirosoma profusum TaxID=2771354 RepID=A0A926Y2L2_9BACT|nr:hypothetical protein [Spirosoma profusum]MBD2700911.1 hypothetical protein [Spirosoma profusum]
MSTSVTIKEGMTYRQIQEAVSAEWPLLTLVLYFPTTAFYKEGHFAEDCYVDPDYELVRKKPTAEPIHVTGDMFQTTLRDLFYKDYYLEVDIAYRYNPNTFNLPGKTLDQKQEDVQRWWQRVEMTHGRKPNAADIFEPVNS